jgi:hypothetical protein
MTTLEITLLVTLIYLIVGIIVYWVKPEDYYAINDPSYEKFAAVMSIFFWPIVIIKLIYDAIADSFDL